MTGERRRESFDGAAADYGRYPAPYPDEVVAGVLVGSGIRAGARALSLTVVHAHHVRGGTPGFFENTQPYYLKWGLSDDPFFQPPAPADAPVMYPELNAQPGFRSVRRRRFEIPRQHTTESYIGWLRTDSLILSLDDQSRAGFLDDIATLIDGKYDGSVARNFIYDVVTART